MRKTYTDEEWYTEIENLASATGKGLSVVIVVDGPKGVGRGDVTDELERKVNNMGFNSIVREVPVDEGSPGNVIVCAKRVVPRETLLKVAKGLSKVKGLSSFQHANLPSED